MIHIFYFKSLTYFGYKKFEMLILTIIVFHHLHHHKDHLLVNRPRAPPFHLHHLLHRIQPQTYHLNHSTSPSIWGKLQDQFRRLRLHFLPLHLNPRRWNHYRSYRPNHAFLFRSRLLLHRRCLFVSLSFSSSFLMLSQFNYYRRLGLQVFFLCL